MGIRHPLHLNDPTHILRAVCGEMNPLLRTDIPDDVTCNFCAYAHAKYLTSIMGGKATEPIRIKPPVPT